jgi:uncharacterized RDD family membrane protein YckC
LSASIDTILTAETPEGIAIALRPAGFPVRCMAFLIDAGIRLVILIACSATLQAGGRLGGGLMFIALFAVNWVYAVIFEMSAAAATPGKRIMGLYVTMIDGMPITPAACLIRNLLRVVDFLPLFYASAAMSMLLRRDARRLGDLAAGTVVAYRDDAAPKLAFGDGLPQPPPVTLSRRQQAAITSFAARVPRLTEERAEEIAALAAGTVLRHSEADARERLSLRLTGVARWLHGERPNAPLVKGSSQ